MTKALTKEKREELRLELRAIRAMQNLETFEDFVARVSPQYRNVPKHLAPLYKLVNRTRHERVRALVSMPPRHGKSVTAHHAIAYRAYLDPASLNVYASYNADQAEPASSKIRQIALRAGANLSRKKLVDWETEYGGGLRATSIGGGITGRGVNDGLAVLDDLIKGWEQANSVGERDKVWNWIRADLMTRMEGIGSIIMFNTRWHPDDHFGRLAADGLGEEWEFINLPAISWEGQPVDEDSAPNYEPLWLGIDPLDPTREGALRKYKRLRALGDDTWESLFQGKPQRSTGEMFGAPSFYDPALVKPEGHVFIACDPAASDKSKADYSVMGAAVGVVRNGELWLYIVDWNRGQRKVPDTVRMLNGFQSKWYGAPVHVEAVAGFKSVPQMLLDIDPSLDVREWLPKGDKKQRAEPAAAAWNRGRILLPQGAEWLKPYVSELREFNGKGAKKDDQVDVTAILYKVAYDELIGESVGRGAYAEPSRYVA